VADRRAQTSFVSTTGGCLLGHTRLLRPGTPIEVRLTTSGDAAWSSLPREAPERFRLPSGLLEEIWPLLLTQNEYGSRHRQTPAQRAGRAIGISCVDLQNQRHHVLAKLSED
jgi:hypothetical protein